MRSLQVLKRYEQRSMTLLGEMVLMILNHTRGFVYLLVFSQMSPSATLLWNVLLYQTKQQSVN